ALAIIEKAHRRRTRRLPANDPELARSHFNLAGVRIRLAQEEPDRAGLHLDLAQGVYEAVQNRRQAIYGRPQHPHIAACVIGRAYVGSYRSLLLAGSEAQRSDWLRDATLRTTEALNMRQAQEGSVDGDEVAKCVRFLAKVALARDAMVSASAPPATFAKGF